MLEHQSTLASGAQTLPGSLVIEAVCRLYPSAFGRPKNQPDLGIAARQAIKALCCDLAAEGGKTLTNREPRAQAKAASLALLKQLPMIDAATAGRQQALDGALGATGARGYLAHGEAVLGKTQADQAQLLGLGVVKIEDAVVGNDESRPEGALFVIVAEAGKQGPDNRSESMGFEAVSPSVDQIVAATTQKETLAGRVVEAAHRPSVAARARAADHGGSAASLADGQAIALGCAVPVGPVVVEKLQAAVAVAGHRPGKQGS